MNTKALIFDLDGVIVDTAKYHYASWKRLSEELGLHFTLEDNELLKGVSRRRSFEIILSLNKCSMTEEQILSCCEKKNTYYLEYINQLKREEVLPGVNDFLLDARRLGLRTAIGSASKNCMLILQRLELITCFDSIIDGTKVSKAKPDPEVFLKGAQSLGVSPENCIVFEDSLAGIIAAHTGGMKAIGVGNIEVKKYCDLFLEGFGTMSVESLLAKVD